MILIIEGMDRCGKSTLIKNLRKTYFQNHKIITNHCVSPPSIVVDKTGWEYLHYKNLIETSIMLSDNFQWDIIFDRFHFGAVVYGSKYRNSDPKYILQLDKNFMSHNDIYTVLLTDHPENIIERNDDESYENSIEDFKVTENAFLEIYNLSCCKNKLHINITENEGFSRTYDTVVAFLKGKMYANHE